MTFIATIESHFLVHFLVFVGKIHKLEKNVMNVTADKIENYRYILILYAMPNRTQLFI